MKHSILFMSLAVFAVGCDSWLEVPSWARDGQSLLQDDPAWASSPGAAVDPCDARNPVALFDRTFVRDTGTPAEKTLAFNSPLEVAACVSLEVPPGTQSPTAGDLSLDGETVIRPSELKKTFSGHSARIVLSEGAHEVRARLRSKPGTALRLRVLVAGPFVDQLAPAIVENGDQIVLQGEGLQEVSAIRSGQQPLTGIMSSTDGASATAVAVSGMRIGPLEVTTPFGTFVTTQTVVPREPRGVVTTYGRTEHPDGAGDGTPDILAVSMSDDGEQGALVVRLAAPLEPNASGIVRLGFDEPENLDLIFERGPQGWTVPDGFKVVESGAKVAVVGPLVSFGTHVGSYLGAFWMRASFSIPGSQGDVFPSGDSPPHQVRPIFAPRYLRYRAANPKDVAERHGATFLLTRRRATCRSCGFRTT